MNRSDLLLAVAKAASAAALGKDDSAAQRSLDGKKFELRIRFGCPRGAATVPKTGPFQVLYKEVERTLQLRATPDLSLDDTWLSSGAAQEVEAVEGFWIKRPWLLESGCPALPRAIAATNTDEVPPAKDQSDKKAVLARDVTVKNAGKDEAPRPEAAALPAQRIGVAQFFTKEDSRLLQRNGRPYETKKVLQEGERPSLSGYDLVFSGRLKTSPRGGVIVCNPVDTDRPPDCVISASIDKVRMEQPQSGTLMAEWSRQ